MFACVYESIWGCACTFCLLKYVGTCDKLNCALLWARVFVHMCGYVRISECVRACKEQGSM